MKVFHLKRSVVFSVSILCVCFIVVILKSVVGTNNIYGYIFQDIMSFRMKRYLKYQETENSRQGFGEQGGGMTGIMPPGFNDVMSREGFNAIASHKMALDRSLPDVRSEKCRWMNYSNYSMMRSASVIIIYHNEEASVVLRTVHSVVNRSPPQLLKEVILVDDASTREDLLEVFHNQIANTWPDGVVRQVKNLSRSGLVVARQLGAESALGDVLIFLDAHCEVTQGWIEPLLWRIGENHKSVVCPSIDHIHAETLQYSAWKFSGTIGTFTWSGHFAWSHSEQAAKGDGVSTYDSPTMAGGLFAMDRKYFFELGGYDIGMEIWGGENLEISFRIWMCGGRLEMSPCSHVGHIFRDSHPYGFPNKSRDYHGLNTKRLVEVWMDDYKRLFYYFRPDLKKADIGDITERNLIRSRLQCHNFQWYLSKLVPNMFIYDDNSTVMAYGMVRNFNSGLCLDLGGQSEVVRLNLKATRCHNTITANQLFSLTHSGNIRREFGCVEYFTGPRKTKQNIKITNERESKNPIMQVQYSKCYGASYQLWRYDKDIGRIQHVQTGLCMDINQIQGNHFQSPILTTCSDSSSQIWTFSNT